MNSTNASPSPNSTAPSAVVLTPYELWIQLVFFYGIIGGIMPTCFGTLICIGIYRRKRLRTRFFAIVASLTFVRATIGVNYMILTLYRSLRTTNLAPTDLSRLACHCIHFIILYNLTVEMSILCFLVVDRIVAIARINYYRLLHTSSALRICILIYLVVGSAKLIPSYLGADMFFIVKCINLYSFLSDGFNTYSTTIDLIEVFVVLFLYFGLIVYLKLRIHHIRESASEAGRLALQRQLKLMPMLRNLVLMHCGLALMAKLFLWLPYVLPEYQQRLVAVGGVLQAIDVFANVMALLVTNRDIKLASIPCLTGGSQVEAMEPTRTSKVIQVGSGKGY